MGVFEGVFVGLPKWHACLSTWLAVALDVCANHLYGMPVWYEAALGAFHHPSTSLGTGTLGANDRTSQPVPTLAGFVHCICTHNCPS